jgi:uncharacterized protein
MKDSENGIKPAIFDASPYLRLFIDKDGKWFQNGTEIIHKEIYLQFNSMLERTPDAGYRVRLGQEVCRVEVEDAPFVVLSVVEDGNGGFVLSLNDGTSENLDPEWFWIGAENVPYSYVKEGVFHARFSRPAYYQLAHHIVTDDEREFFLLIRGERIPITRDETRKTAG